MLGGTEQDFLVRTSKQLPRRFAERIKHAAELKLAPDVRRTRVHYAAHVFPAAGQRPIRAYCMLYRARPWTIVPPDNESQCHCASTRSTAATIPAFLARALIAMIDVSARNSNQHFSRGLGEKQRYIRKQHAARHEHLCMRKHSTGKKPAPARTIGMSLGLRDLHLTPAASKAQIDFLPSAWWLPVQGTR